MSRRLRLLVACIPFLISLWVMPLAVAASSSDQGIVRSYGTDGTVRQGMIVALKPSDPTKVVPLTSATVTSMFGVAILPNDAPITVSGDAGTRVYIATSGQYNVLVSNQNGVIHAGDYITISSLNGVGMKADESQPTVLGRAAADLTTRDILEGQVSIKTSNGSQVVALGVVPVVVAIGNNPKAGNGTGNLPGFLQIASSNIAAKPVAASRVYLSLAVLLLAAFISGSILYSGVRGSILSIGRNPLARHSIMGGLFQTITVGVIVFVLGLFGVYLLLRL